MLELHLLEQLLALERHGTLSAASAALHLSQPALSRSMQKLEALLGVPLFERDKNRIRLNATLSSNVVTYIVEVNTDNPDGMLKPYLTANVKFIREARRGVLAIPSSALRYTPDVKNIAPEALANPIQADHDEALLWIEKSEGLLTPVKVKVGLNNGTMAEIVTDDLKEGDVIITGVDNSAAMRDPADEGMPNNPFMPRMPRFSGRGSAGARERASQREAAAGAAGGAVTAPGGRPGAGGPGPRN